MLNIGAMMSCLSAPCPTSKQVIVDELLIDRCMIIYLAAGLNGCCMLSELTYSLTPPNGVLKDLKLYIGGMLVAGCFNC
jgi:hypothetical protein